ncbi:hypothetical protein A0H81_02006 [Grifola frondosa]|uniref:Uncharacterized protein n=1 Tax=Grifola frondosa TaxID=5627 RepID=A0A1C7MNJ9_GRIFR|nr:hypothetical protein A0H81_02006 [Grifola frondosa]
MKKCVGQYGPDPSCTPTVQVEHLCIRLTHCQCNDAYELRILSFRAEIMAADDATIKFTIGERRRRLSYVESLHIFKDCLCSKDASNTHFLTTWHLPSTHNLSNQSELLVCHAVDERHDVIVRSQSVVDA